MGFAPWVVELVCSYPSVSFWLSSVAGYMSGGREFLEVGTGSWELMHKVNKPMMLVYGTGVQIGKKSICAI